MKSKEAGTRIYVTRKTQRMLQEVRERRGVQSTWLVERAVERYIDEMESLPERRGAA